MRITAVSSTITVALVLVAGPYSVIQTEITFACAVVTNAIKHATVPVCL